MNNYCRSVGGLAVTAGLDIVCDEHDVGQPDVVFSGPNGWVCSTGAP